MLNYARDVIITIIINYYLFALLLKIYMSFVFFITVIIIINQIISLQNTHSEKRKN